MYYTNPLIKYVTLTILIVSSIGCAQLPENTASTETS
ncbi:hypothetical protein MNBD_GAMMA12-2271, partial [hydrothermal vent metagenome]